MWKRRRTWLVLAALSCVALAVYFEPTRCVRGWLWGEAFFDGRPTSALISHGFDEKMNEGSFGRRMT